MANIKSQIKRNRQNEARRVRNKAVRTSLKTVVKKVRTPGEAADPSASDDLIRQATRLFDKAASKGIIPKRTAARKKSRLARLVSATRSP